MIYENKKIYLEITCPYEFIENYDIKNIQKDYIIEEKTDKNPRKIAITDLYCCCGNKSQNEYYCLDSQKNLCSNCIGKEKDHSNHSIVNFNDDKIQIIIKDNKNINLNRNIKEENITDNNDNENDNNELIQKLNFFNDGDYIDNFKEVIILLKELVDQYKKINILIFI